MHDELTASIGDNTGQQVADHVLGRSMPKCPRGHTTRTERSDREAVCYRRQELESTHSQVDLLPPPNGQGSAAAVQRKRATASRLPRLSAATAVRLWAGHMPTTWRGTQTRPETEAACDQPPEQEYEFDTITPKPSALPKSTTDGAHARNPGQTEKSWLPNNAPSTKARARRPAPPDAPTKSSTPIKHGGLDQPNGHRSAADRSI